MIQVENLSFTYLGAARPSLSAIDLSIGPGEFVLLCGPTGCGKSTLLRMLKPELLPVGERTGRVLYRGREIGAQDRLPEIGFVMQMPEQQVVTDRVWHELAFGLENLGVPSDVIRRRSAEIAAYFDLEKSFEKDTNALSGGEKQQLVVAATMIMGCKVLLLDEPTSQLDPIAANRFFLWLEQLRREFGITILMAEHHLEEIFGEADRVVYMEDGSIRAQGTPAQTALSLLRSGNAFSAALPTVTRLFYDAQAERALFVSLREAKRAPEYETLAETVKRSLPQAGRMATDAASGGAEDAFGKGLSAISLQNVSFGYDAYSPIVLNDLSLEIPAGACTAIVGGNGSGKTTLLKVIAGLVPEKQCSGGKVRIFGKARADAEKKRKKDRSSGEKAVGSRQEVAFLMQDVSTLFTEETVYEEIVAGMREKVEEGGNGYVETFLKDHGFEALAAHLKQHPYDLSGGEQQMLGLTKLMLRDPKILLLDEPTKGMDAVAKERLAALIGRKKAAGVTVVLVTHDLDFAERCADQAAMLFRGEILSQERADRFFADNVFYTTHKNRALNV